MMAGAQVMMSGDIHDVMAEAEDGTPAAVTASCRGLPGRKHSFDHAGGSDDEDDTGQGDEDARERGRVRALKAARDGPEVAASGTARDHEIHDFPRKSIMRIQHIITTIILSACQVDATTASVARELPQSPAPAPAAALYQASGPPAPTPVTGPELTFAVIGDYGMDGDDEERVAELVKSWDPALVITTGDNNYESGKASTIEENIDEHYGEFIAIDPETGSTRFFPSLGNHDVKTKKGEPYLEHFELPGNERYYDFVRGPVHFFALNSTSIEPDGRTADSEQGLWLEERLALSTAPWKIVYFHHSPYSSGKHGMSSDSDEEEDRESMRWPFKEWGASAVLTGHDHHYERLIVDDFPYMVNGLGGHDKRKSACKTDTPEHGSELRFCAKYGAQRVTATDTALTFEFIAVGGEVIDELTLTAEPAVEG
jgi:hypothetical protein